MTRLIAPAVRFMRFLSPEPNTGCLLFTGATQTRGYGSFGAGTGKSMLAHRFAWELEKGPIPEGLTVDHMCGGPLVCCNVRHLQLVTREINVALASSRLTHCARGHLRTPETVHVRPDGRRRCLACHKIESRLYGQPERDEAAATEAARLAWPELFAAAEKRIAGIVNQRKRLTLNTEVSP